MTKLETQINQIFLLDPTIRKTEVILYEEKLNHLSHLFFIAQVSELPKKISSTDLKKIAEIIMKTFHSNKRLPKETLFESSLAEINQALADLAHGGRRSWLGKLSALAVIKSGESVFLANSGQTSAWLARGKQIYEILPPEKKGLHPLKFFSNFTSGKIQPSDSLILTTSNLFNYVSLELFKQKLAEMPLPQATAGLAEIIKQTNYQQESLACFLLSFGPSDSVEPTEDKTIYAPVPEEAPLPARLIDKFPKLSGLQFGKFSQLSRARKFFLASFAIFVLLFFLNLAVFAVRTANAKRAAKTNAQYDVIVSNLNQAESALIYKNDQEAVDYLKLASEGLEKLKELDKSKAAEALKIFQMTSDKINRISVVENPQLIITLAYSPTFLARAGSGFIFAGSDPKTVSVFDGSSLKSLLLINSVEGGIRGLVHAQTNGNLAAGANTIYRINQINNLFEAVKQVPNSDLIGLRFLSPNRVYTLDKASNQVYRLTFAGNSVSAQSMLRSAVDLKNAQDIGIDSDIYILFPDRIIKAVSGNPQELKLTIADNISEANRIFVGSNIYILESSQKRLLIFSKTGKLQNQIFFPNMNAVKDLYVDENQRFIYLLDENKLWQITF